MPQGTHPNSLKNLTHDGRPLKYHEPKKTRRLSVTETGWTQAQTLIDAMGMSVSEFIEELARGRVTVLKTHELEALQKALDAALLHQSSPNKKKT